MLAEDGVVHRDGDAWHWIADSYPANAVNLRGVADGNFVVVDLSDGGKTVIAEVDYGSAALTLYENAIYMVQSRPWQVERLDWVGRKAFVTRTEADYYTDAIDYQKVKVLEAFEADASGRGECAHGEIHHVRRVTGYKKIRYYMHENIGYGKVDLPDQEMHTTSVWWRLPGDALDRAFDSRWEALDGFLGAAHALHTVAAVRAMSEPLDLGRAVGSGQGDWHAVAEPGRRGGIRDAADRELDPATLARFEPTVFLYDNHPGGSGLAAPLYRARDGLLADATLLVHDCACARGCPACIGPVLEHDEQRGRDAKRAALQVLALLAGGTGPDAPAVAAAR